MMKRNKIISERLRQNNGFTLIEVIAVLVIIAILAAVVVVRGISTTDVELQAEIDTLKGHIRYAQYLAMNDISPTQWGISVGGSSYELVKYVVSNSVYTKQAQTFKLPNESSITHVFKSPINATKTGTILFDGWGSPDFESAKLTGVNPIIITTLGPGSKSIEIYPETGLIE